MELESFVFQVLSLTFPKLESITFFWKRYRSPRDHCLYNIHIGPKWLEISPVNGPTTLLVEYSDPDFLERIKEVVT